MFLPIACVAASFSRIAFSARPNGEAPSRQAIAKQIAAVTSASGRNVPGVSSFTPNSSMRGIARMPSVPPVRSVQLSSTAVTMICSASVTMTR